MSTNQKPTNLEEYYAIVPESSKQRLSELQSIIQQVLPNAIIKISYSIPSFYEDGYIVYMAGWEKYVSLYPVHRSGLGDELAEYISGKSTARFYHDKPLPKELIQKIVRGLYDDLNKRRKK